MADGVRTKPPDPRLSRAIVARVAADIPETEELWRASWWLESMLALGLEIVSVEELGGVVPLGPFAARGLP